MGKYHACVLITTNTPGTNDIMCWGLNKDGQLGEWDLPQQPGACVRKGYNSLTRLAPW